LGEQDESLDVMLEKFARAAMRRRWWLLGPTVAVALSACALSKFLPNRYTSEAAILVEHQQVPVSVVTPNSTSDIRETLLITTDAILSRTQLLSIIDEFSLYPKERKRLSPEELVALMRTKISIKPLDSAGGGNSLNAFKISFTGTSPHLAQDVTRKLTTLFIQENDRTTSTHDRNTTSFLAGEVATAGERLKQIEEQVREFKMRNLGALPEQQQGNLSILSGYQSQLESTQAALSRAREQQVLFQTELTQYQELPPAMVGSTVTPGGAIVDPAASLRTKLDDLKSQRTALLASGYTQKYPDVAKLDEEIKSTEAAIAAGAKKGGAPAAQGGDKQNTETANASDNNIMIAQLRSQIAANDLEIKNDIAAEKQIEGQIAEYRNRLNMTPVTEQQLAELNRNYELSKKNYEDLLSRKTQSELGTSFDEHQQGQQFHIIDQPSLPMKPASPNHLAIALGGLGAGLALGVGLVSLMETRDHSLFNEKDLSHLFSFPLMVGMPVLTTKDEVQKRSRMHKLEWLAGAALCLLVCVTEIYIYRLG